MTDVAKLFFIVVLVSATFLIYKLYVEKEVQPGIQRVGSYRVSEVFDGDTIEVEMDGRREKVRLVGVDTPETGGNDTPVECFGKEATNHTSKLLRGKYVLLTADPLSSNRDRYERLLRYVKRADDDLDVNLELVSKGYSPSYAIFPFHRSAEFDAAAKKAKENGLGLWAACSR